MNELIDFRVGDRVRKQGGRYSYSGVVVSAFLTLAGTPRYVVESTVPGASSLLFIFNAESLRHVDESERVNG